MCITVNKASLSGTKILSIPSKDGKHFIAYSNNAKNLSGKPNAMILPIPGKTSPDMFYNTEKYKDFLDEIIKECQLNKYEGWESRGLMSKGLKSYDSFELGQYTIGLAESFQGARDFLAQLPENKRPEVSEELKKFFEEKYEGWSFAVCVFDSENTIDAQPIAFEYVPFSEDLIYFPTVDGHDGGAPNLEAYVNTDHTFLYEHTGPMTRKYYMTSVKLKAEVPEFLKDRKYRSVTSSGLQKNGDTFVDGAKLTETDFEVDGSFKRVPPVPNIILK